MKLLGWQCTVQIVIKVIGVVGVTGATAFTVPAVGMITTGSDNAGELLSKTLYLKKKGAADTFPVNSLDYILGDSIFGSLMFASADHGGAGHSHQERGQINGTPVSVDAGYFLLAT